MTGQAVKFDGLDQRRLQFGIKLSYRPRAQLAPPTADAATTMVPEACANVGYGKPDAA